MSSSLKVRWLIDTEANTFTPRSLARARLSRAAALLIWSTSSRAPVSSARARSRSSMIFSAMTETPGRPRREANSPSMAAPAER